MKSVRIRSFPGPYFPAFGLNTERYEVSLRILSECRKMLTRKTPNTEIRTLFTQCTLSKVAGLYLGGRSFLIEFQALSYL